jgi:hypothetical protein
MEISLREGTKGGYIVVVKFEKDTNFDPVKLEWVPRKSELEKIGEAVRQALGVERKQK